MSPDLLPLMRAANAMACCLVFACMGCGNGQPPAYKTTGKVVFSNGTPVKTGTVELKSREHAIQARVPSELMAVLC